jgi:hypothetical protein
MGTIPSNSRVIISAVLAHWANCELQAGRLNLGLPGDHRHPSRMVTTVTVTIPGRRIEAGPLFGREAVPTPKAAVARVRSVLLDRENLPVSESGLTRVRLAQKLVFTDPYRRSTAELFLR